MPLPKWVTDNASSIRDEAAPYKGLTPEQRAVMLAAACRAGARLLGARADAAAILAHRDPVPESTELALARLRAEMRAGHDSTE